MFVFQVTCTAIWDNSDILILLLLPRTMSRSMVLLWLGSVLKSCAAKKGHIEVQGWGCNLRAWYLVPMLSLEPS